MNNREQLNRSRHGPGGRETMSQFLHVQGGRGGLGDGGCELVLEGQGEGKGAGGKRDRGEVLVDERAGLLLWGAGEERF